MHWCCKQDSEADDGKEIDGEEDKEMNILQGGTTKVGLASMPLQKQPCKLTTAQHRQRRQHI